MNHSRGLHFVQRIVLCAFLFSVAGRCQQAGPVVSQGQQEPLRLVVCSSKDRLKQDEPITLEVKLVNTSTEKVSIFGQLLWGYAGGLILHVSDQQGHPVEPKQHDEDIVVPSLLGKPTSYVVLFPDHFLGTERPDSASNLFPRPGSYSLSVEYRSPVPAHYAQTANFWGRESKPIWSAPIRIEVVRR